jgi:membrane peptidoglycan carboxypeptidase
MSEKTADTINTLLRGVVEDGTGQQAGLSGRDSAGKTGTTDERRAAWFVGYTPNMAGAVWVGGPATKVTMENISIGGQYYAKVFGGGVPGPIWRDAMAGALEGRPIESFITVPIAEPKDDKRDKPGGGKPGRPGRDGSPLPGLTIAPDIIGGDGGFAGGNGSASIGTDGRLGTRRLTTG